jgi:hypothetical protein
MQKLQRIFKVVRDEFHALVPPLTATVDQEHHYEVWAEYDGKKTFFGKVVLHKDTVQIAFYPGISRETEYTLFPGDIFKRMEDALQCQIADLSPELESNIIEGIRNLVDYFRAHHLLAPEPNL